MKNYLRAKWEEALPREAFPAAVAEFENIFARYGEPWRHYHDTSHVFQLLKFHDELGQGDPDVIIAIFYHDAVYDPKRKDNEEQSAELARAFLGQCAGMEAARINWISDAILATRDHSKPVEDEKAEFFLDLDLSILGAPAEVYRKYAASVRKEYAWVPEILFRMNRGKFLKKTLSAPRIFRTEACRTRFEDRARVNLEWELGECAIF